ncbi:hypothetical protein HU200_030300 [Digitaria exilis]|uniref:Pentatricopeptide repeat-containing protein n=1 Tax=Digitaria exilis TaxID=1010633 RepID=A0A835BRL2_9POAL|nr:hypothetical protein HU200_030300 [Digitaria exilis]
MLLNIPYCKSQAPVAAVAAISSLRFSSSSSPALIPPPSEPLASPSPALVEENLFAALLASDPPPPEPLRLVLAAGDVHSALRGLPGLARQLFRWAEDTPRGFPRTASAFAAVLVPLAQANHIRAAYPVSLRALHLGLLLPLVSFLLSTDISPATKSLLSLLLRLSTKFSEECEARDATPPPEGREDKAAMVLKEMETQGIGCLPNDVTYNVVISWLTRKGELGEAVELVDWMRLSKKASSFTYNMLIAGFFAKGFLKKVEALQLVMENEGDLDEARRLKEEMVEQGCLPDVCTYTILMNGSHKMISDRLPPSAVTYTVLIHAYCRKGNLYSAYGWFQKMLEEGVEPNEITYNVLIHALCRMGRTQLAYHHFYEMLERGLAPNKYTYTLLIDGNCKEGSWEDAMRLYFEMYQNGIHPDHCTHKALLKGFDEGHMKNAIEYLENVVLAE